MQQHNIMERKATLVLAGFSLACLSAGYWPVLPHPLLLTVVLIAACLFHTFAGLRRHLSFVPPLLRNSLLGYHSYSASTLMIGLAAGSLWMASLGYWYLTWQLPEQNNPRNAQVTLLITATAIYEQKTCRLTGIPQTGRLIDQLLKPKFQLYWRSDSKTCPYVGARIHVKTRLKPPQGVVNPGAPLRTKRLLAQRVVKTGYIKSVLYTEPRQASSLHQRAVTLLTNKNLSGWALALLVGDRTFLTQQDWELLTRSGTAHLFSLSGMHLGLVALWALFISKGILPIARAFAGGREQVSIRIPVLIASAVLCTIYAALANWQLPVVRALILLSVFVVMQTLQRQTRAMDTLWLMIALCCLLFPFSVYSASFYLSIGAVSLIWYFAWWAGRPRSDIKGRFLWSVKLQLFLCVFLTPVTLLWFNAQSLIAPIINLVAIPAITLLLPVGLISLFLMPFHSPMADALLRVFDDALGILMTVIRTMAQWWPMLTSYWPAPSFIAAFLALLVICLPPFRTKWLCIGLLCIPALSSSLSFNPNKWYLHVFDVGQGTALLISRGEQGVLIDTGASFSSQSLLLQQIAPALEHMQITTLKNILISHHDNDHAGGLKDITRLSQVGWNTVISSPVDDCQAGMTFTLQGINFSAVWPESGNRIKGNDYSCVIKISDGEHTILAPGDIERWAEYQLLYTNRLSKADVLIAPHHGSATSSANAFVQKISPEWVVFTQGRDNRWNFPARQVSSRYQALGAHIMKTSESGYIRFEFSPGAVPKIREWVKHNRRWYYR